jgi:hypothetical protein
MGGSRTVDQRAPDEVARLTEEVQALRARLETLESAQRPGGNGHGEAAQSRRDVLKLAGAAAAGAAGSILLGTVPAAATSGQPVVLGNATTNDAAATTDIFPTAATAPAPLFQATGQSVTTTTTVPPTASTTAPLSQSIPLIGAIGAGGTLPAVGTNPADYPGFAPIQGVGGLATVAGSVVSEGVNGWGRGSTGIGVTGESDIGYGVVGSSAGIDLAAYGHGRILQLSLLNAALASPPAGPPNYTPNDFEQARDGNGTLYLSVLGGGWVPVQPGGFNTGFFTAVSTQQYRLTGSDGSTWVDMDISRLVLSITPLFNCYAVLTANSDLWTAVANYNQDIGVFVSGGAFGSGQIVGWKESGGRSGTFSPNAAFLQTVAQLARGTTYVVKLQWKTNQASSSSVTIFAGAGLGPVFSPTRLSAQLIVNP